MCIKHNASKTPCRTDARKQYLLNVLDLHAVLVDKSHPLLSQQIASVTVHDALNLGINFNHQSLCLLQPLLTCIQDLLILL